MRNRLVFLGIFSFVLLLVVFIMFYRGQGTDWRETYKPASEEPYGTKFIKSLLADLYEDHDFTVIDKPLKHALDETPEQFNYVFIDHSVRMEQASMERLVKQIHNGNKAFIASKEVPLKLLGRILDPGNKEYYYKEAWEEAGAFPLAKFSKYEDTTVSMGLYQRDLPTDEPIDYYFQGRFEQWAYGWNFFDTLKDRTATDRVQALGFLQPDLVNFFQVDFGEGSFYFHLGPLAFTNYHINREEGFAYARQAFSYLDAGPIYFDEFENPLGTASNQSNNPRYGDSPLQFILNQTSLRWAWYWGLLMVIFYLFLRGKRRQRIIPVLPSYSNDTLAFVQNIGRLHYKQSDIRGISKKQMGVFLTYLRDHYNLATNIDEGQLARQAGGKAGLDPQLITSIFTKYREILKKEEASLTEGDLRIFYSMINNFISKSK